MMGDVERVLSDTDQPFEDSSAALVKTTPTSMAARKPATGGPGRRPSRAGLR
jgi:hypothetical protein